MDDHGTARGENARSDRPWDAGLAVAVMEALPDATAVLDRTGRIIAVNRAWEMFALDNGGRPEATGIGVSYLEVCARAAATGNPDAADVLTGLRAVLAGETVEREREYPCDSPEVSRWFISRITSMGAPVGGAVTSHVNITRRKRAEMELAFRAAHDPLTGLANRTLFTERLSGAIGSRAGRGAGSDVGVLFVDLDGFKPVNDTFGHDAGDELLLIVAHRLRSLVRAGDTIARLGGDEFAACVLGINQHSLADLADRIRTAIAEPHQIHGCQVRVTASIGTYLARTGDGAAGAIQQADRAMYAAKRAMQAAAGGVGPGR